MTLIKCLQMCSLWGGSVSSLGKPLSLCVGALDSQLALFRVVVLKADLLGATLKCRPDFIRCLKWTYVGCSPFLEARLLTAHRNTFLRR